MLSTDLFLKVTRDDGFNLCVEPAVAYEIDNQVAISSYVFFQFLSNTYQGKNTIIVPNWSSYTKTLETGGIEANVLLATWALMAARSEVVVTCPNVCAVLGGVYEFRTALNTLEQRGQAYKRSIVVDTPVSASRSRITRRVWWLTEARREQLVYSLEYG